MASSPESSWWRIGGKRAFDIGVAAIALVVLSPLLAILAIAVRLDSKGPALFRQERVGKNFRPFRILKFRTMVVDAPKLGGPLTAGDHDPRITRSGRFLRATKLDELPQLINVLQGDMSFVGPRPEVAKYVDVFRDQYKKLLSVRPGITDPSSLRYRNEGSLLAASNDPESLYLNQILPDKIRLSGEYVDSLSFRSDFAIIVSTATSMFWNRQAR
jgi:lipopolysaccharide/colanic/teichoic acid biosynthesis glycosyltransferase